MVLQSIRNLLGYVPLYVWGILVLAVAYVYNLYVNQNNLLYHPQLPMLPSKRTSDNPLPFQSPANWNLDYEDVYISTADNVRLHAWFVKTATGTNYKTSPTIVFFHANAGNMGLRLPNVDALVHLDVNVLIFDYRGYGNSDDVPIHEEGLKLDGAAIMKYIESRQDIDRRKVFLFGRSLGGAVAVHTAANFSHAVAGIILENTFTSISDMVDHVFPVLSKIKWLILKIEWRTVDVISKIEQPLLFISGARDQLVPPAMLKRLYASAISSKDKSIYIVSDGDHNDTFQKGGDEYKAKIKSFIQHITGKSIPQVQSGE